MDHPSRIICALVLVLLANAGALADDPSPLREPSSGVGAVSLGGSSLEAEARRLAERIESAADDGKRLDTALSNPRAIDAETALPAPRPGSGASRVPEAGASVAPIPISDRFGRGLGGMIGDPNEPATPWWKSPEIRVLGFLGVLGVAALVIRRMSIKGSIPGASRPSGVISVMARYPFGRGASLVLIECGPRIVLLHQHGGRGGDVTSVAEFTDSTEIAQLRTSLGAAERREGPGFRDDLLKNLGRYDRKGRPQGFGGGEGIPLNDMMETVDLTRRRPRRGARGG